MCIIFLFTNTDKGVNNKNPQYNSCLAFSLLKLRSLEFSRSFILCCSIERRQVLLKGNHQGLQVSYKITLANKMLSKSLLLSLI